MIGNGGDGDKKNVDIIEKWGGQSDVDTVDASIGVISQIIWPIKSSVQQYLFLDSPIQLFLNSTSANDTLIGTGARSVKGMYHDNNGENKSFELDLDGLSNVALPTTSYGCFRFSIETSGTLNTNDGDLRIVDGSGNIYAIVIAGEGQTQISVLRVPNNKKGKVKYHKTDYSRNSATINDATMRFRVRKTDGTIITKWDPTIGSNKPEDEKQYRNGITVYPGEWAYWECLNVSANNTPLRGSFDIDLEDI